MDPQAAWDQLLCAYVAGDWAQIDELATALVSWLDRGGFPPRILARSALPDWDRALAYAGCRLALHTGHDRWCIAGPERKDVPHAR